MKKLLLILLAITPIAYADSVPSTFGEIKYEDSNSTSKETYAETVAKTASYFENFYTVQEQLKNGQSPQAPASLNKESLFYLTGLYLYCIQRSGVCKLIPDSLYEVTLVQAQAGSPEACSALKVFWELWQEQGMEERSKYVVPMASIKDLSDYNEQERPKLLSCKSTVASDLGVTSKDFFKQRYENNQRLATLGKTLSEVIKQLQTKEVNVFLATGAMTKTR